LAETFTAAVKTSTRFTISRYPESGSPLTAEFQRQQYRWFSSGAQAHGRAQKLPKKKRRNGTNFETFDG
jgi:hypothetical protein